MVDPTTLGVDQLKAIKGVFVKENLIPSQTIILSSPASRCVITGLAVRGGIGEDSSFETVPWLGEIEVGDVWGRVKPYIINSSKNVVMVDHQHNIEAILTRLTPFYIHTLTERGKCL